MNKLILLIGALAITGCGDDGDNIPGNQCGAGTTEVDGECVSDAVCGDGTVLTDGLCIPDGTTPPRVFTQVEHLARPGINEALLISDGFLGGYNATAPSFAGVPSATLGQVVAEAKTVLKAIYIGTCLINGTLGLTAANGAHPAGLECEAVGFGVFAGGANGDLETIDPDVLTAAGVYADAVFGLFIPDVMRIDTGVGTSTYENLCGGTSPVGLCGGRFVRDDVIDVTYDFLINGAQTCVNGIPAIPGNQCGSYNQVSALVSDGVTFANAGNVSSRHPTDTGNTQQGHPLVTNGFPYSAAPL